VPAVLRSKNAAPFPVIQNPDKYGVGVVLVGQDRSNVAVAVAMV